MESPPERNRLAALSFSALGIVFGDIGTSPLYAFRAAMAHLSITTAHIYGVLSLIFWSLIIIVCFKYLLVVFRADNDGEGGVLALAGIIRQKITYPGLWLLLVTIFGVGLIIGDGILTPAISILSALEGLQPLSIHLQPYIIPSTIIILLLLFWMQRIGTGRIGILFAPVILVWFIIIGLLGFLQIIQYPNVLMAVNPRYVIQFFIENKGVSLLTLGGVFLVITGGEALYADLGHFGKQPIRIAWFCVALPGLFLSYFGQGALLLLHPESINFPFYNMAPRWFLPILIILATAATIVASQAIISAAFSILKQATLLNLVPRLKIIYTSTVEKGQVYLPFVNFILLICTCALVLTFKSSNHLASAFGIAVNLDMIITTILVAIIAYVSWQWNIAKLLLFPIFLTIEIAFLAGNLPKFMDGGWVPILIAFATIVVMYTWHRGFKRLRKLNHRDALFNQFIIDELNQQKISHQPGMALFITDPYDDEGRSLLYHLRINRMMYETMVFLTIKVENRPYIPLENKFEVIQKAEGLYLLNVHYGFAEYINLPETLEKMVATIKLPFALNLRVLVYFLQIISAEVTPGRAEIWRWQKLLFAIMLRNAVPDIQFYQLPFSRTIAIGSYYHL